ncbi:MAG TPA: hypothetical protein VHL13_09170 [Pseudolabrys sp.]|jgi:hypothetical protein|nr:hypothetical protein [Pseudolabrys sp.]
MPCTDLMRVGALILAFATLAGCSEYGARRDTISAYGGNAPETNKIVQMVDPWPAHAADRNIAYNGTVMQSAVERYRTGRVIPPRGTGTAAAYQQSNAPSNNNTPTGPSINQPAAGVK